MDGQYRGVPKFSSEGITSELIFRPLPDIGECLRTTCRPALLEAEKIIPKDQLQKTPLRFYTRNMPDSDLITRTEAYFRENTEFSIRGTPMIEAYINPDGEMSGLIHSSACGQGAPCSDRNFHDFRNAIVDESDDSASEEHFPDSIDRFAVR